MNRYTRTFHFPLHLHIDLKPNLTKDALVKQLQSGSQVSTILKTKLRLSATATALLRRLDKHTFTNPQSKDYNALMTVRAWKHVKLFLDEVLK